MVIASLKCKGILKTFACWLAQPLTGLSTVMITYWKCHGLLNQRIQKRRENRSVNVITIHGACVNFWRINRKLYLDHLMASKFDYVHQNQNANSKATTYFYSTGLSHHLLFWRLVRYTEPSVQLEHGSFVKPLISGSFSCLRAPNLGTDRHT